MEELFQFIIARPDWTCVIIGIVSFGIVIGVMLKKERDAKKLKGPSAIMLKELDLMEREDLA